MTATVTAVLDDGTTLATGAIDKPVDELTKDISGSLKAPGSVLTLHAGDGTVVIPVRSILYVRIEDDDVKVTSASPRLGHADAP